MRADETQDLVKLQFNTMGADQLRPAFGATQAVWIAGWAVIGPAQVVLCKQQETHRHMRNEGPIAAGRAVAPQTATDDGGSLPRHQAGHAGMPEARCDKAPIPL